MKLKRQDFISAGQPVLFLFLIAIWVVINNSVAPVLLIVGAAVALVIARLTSANAASWTGSVWCAIRVTPRTAWHFLIYSGVFIVELVRANLAMLRYVYARRIDIHPGVVRVTTRLTSPIGRLALANSIALTPGSLVLGLEGDTLYIHWLDVKTTDREEASRIIVGPFEKHLEAAFG